MPKRTLIALTLVAALALACDAALVPAEGEGQPSDSPALMAPPRVGFDPVADALIATCGTLDCHGQPGRNLRLFGNHGLRLASKDDPGGLPTTAAERQADYWSVIGLEPEVLDLVVRAGGAGADRLSIVRKGRGTERHKGGAVSREGDAFDRCLLGWLAGKPVQELCHQAVPRRPGDQP
jgi:hypothetical protein